MADVRALFAHYTPDQQQAVLEILDTVSRPMQPREIEAWLRHKGGVPRARAVKLASTLKHVHVIALFGPEPGNG